MLRALRTSTPFAGGGAAAALRIVRKHWIDFGTRNKMEKLPLEVLENRPADRSGSEQSALAPTQRRQIRRRSPPAGRSGEVLVCARSRTFRTSTSSGARSADRHLMSRLARRARSWQYELKDRWEGDNGLPDV